MEALLGIFSLDGDRDMSSVPSSNEELRSIFGSNGAIRSLDRRGDGIDIRLLGDTASSPWSDVDSTIKFGSKGAIRSLDNRGDFSAWIFFCCGVIGVGSTKSSSS